MVKYIIGVLSVIVTLSGITLLILAIWNIYPFTWTTIWKTIATVSLVVIAVSAVGFNRHWFFRKEKFDKEVGNRAHPRNNR